MNNNQKLYRNFTAGVVQLYDEYRDVIAHWEHGTDPFKRALASTILDAVRQENRISDNENNLGDPDK